MEGEIMNAITEGRTIKGERKMEGEKVKKGRKEG